MRTPVQFTAEPRPRWVVSAGASEAELVLDSTGLCLARFGADVPRVGAAARPGERAAVALRCVDRNPFGRLTLVEASADAREWALAGWQIDEEDRAVRLTVRLTSPVLDDGADAGRLVLTETVWLSTEVAMLRRWSELTNESATPVRVGRYHLLDLALEVDPADRDIDLCFVDTFAGHRLDTWEPGDGNFAVHQRRLKPASALRLHVGAYREHCSWLAIAGAGETATSGAVLGLEYDGAADLRVFDAGRTAGAWLWGADAYGPRGTRIVAAPVLGLQMPVETGASWRAPAAFVALFDAADPQARWDAAAQVTHAVVERHLAPPIRDENFPYVIFNSWGYAFDIDPATLLRCLDIAAEIGCEVFVADYGWMRDVGDWVSVGDRMPPLARLRALTRERGMKLGAWMGFANAAENAPVLTEHPDWRAHPNDWGSFGTRALCLAEPAVRDWVVGEIVRVVTEHELDYLVHDFELITACTHPGHAHPADPTGHHSAAGYCDVLRRVRAACPDLLIENCQGGGRIMTYEMVATHDTSVTADCAPLGHSLTRRQAIFGASYPFPLRFCDNYMEERPTDYACHSSMLGGPWILMHKATEWTPTEIACATRNVALYKRIRRYYRVGRLHHLRMPDGVSWDGAQVHLGAEEHGVLLLFQPPGSRAGQVDTVLPGLNPAATYRLTSTRTGNTFEVREARLHLPLPAGTSDVVLVEKAP